ncbi:MAG: COR domain-containing protein [Cyanobacteria bacterium J06634_5]
MPDVFGQLTNLTDLWLNNNQITQIPEVLGQLTNLTDLCLSNNQITQIPEVLGQLTNLTYLFLDNNQITQIPEVLGQLTNLTQLVLSNNQITQIPEVFGQLTNLTDLFLDNNQITQIPEVLRQLTNLTYLWLSNNQITQIPDVLRQLTNLTYLWLSNNQITQIPDVFGQLTNLTYLGLSNNQITQIPDVFEQLTNLTNLWLSNNQITQIPDVLGQLTNLTQLDLENNDFNTIPHCLNNLTQLTRLDLRNNPLPISTEILGPSDVSKDPGSPRQIFRYLQEMNSGEKRQLNEAKLLLIGQGSVGKTSLVKRLLHGTYNPNESQTDGLNVTNWTIEVNTKPVRLNVWDFGGQEIYHATHQFFLTKRSLYILTCNCRTSEDENRIEYWLKLIQSFGGNSPVIIVGNKSDEQPLDINRKALKDKYPNIKAILETSCANGKGIEQLRTTITQEVAKLHDVYNLLPLTWFQVKEQLEEMDEDFITYNRYTGLCYEQKVTEEQSQDQLIDLLHNLGLVLNFRNHPILKDTNVLNPDWVTTGIYAILSDDTLKTKTKGIFTTSDLDRILPSDRYPAKRYPYLTELMKEFQLGFRIDSCTPAKFLIPGLLPKDEPENTNLQGDTLDFQYHYRILPESILSRFIVLTHEDIHNETYWRSGVMLHHTEGDSIENIARIKADPEDKKIFIAISGKNATRRTFLTILRKVFAKIHNSFANLTVTEWVPVPDHPDHPPIDYQELLGAEAMGDTTYTIGKLRKRINLRKLLDGYESLEARQQRRRDERGKEGRFEEEQLARSIRDINIHITNDNNNQQSQEAHQPMSNTIHQHGQGDNFAGDQVHGDKIHTQINNSTDLTQAARDIKTLLTELDQQYDHTTADGQELIEAKAIKAIQGNPTLKKRVFNAVKEGSAAALESAIEHPVAKPVIATIKGFIDA